MRLRDARDARVRIEERRAGNVVPRTMEPTSREELSADTRLPR